MRPGSLSMTHNEKMREPFAAPRLRSVWIPAGDADAASAAVEWSEGDPLVFGGDMNLRPARDPFAFVELRERFGLAEPTGPNAIDHLLARGLEAAARPRRLPPEEREVDDADGLRIRLSDHAPVVATFVR